MVFQYHNDDRSVASRIKELAKWIPLRLTPEERHLLTVLEQTLNVSEYTDHVDVASRRSGMKTRRILEGIIEACHTSTGLTVCSGQEPTGSSRQHVNGTSTTANHQSRWFTRDPADNAALFQRLFEIGRRNKVLNPSSMRATYGKLMYLLQDSQNPTVAKSIGFSLYKPLTLVGSFLEENECLDLLNDPRLECAIQHIIQPEGQSNDEDRRGHLAALVNGKKRVMNDLVKEYSSRGGLSVEQVRLAIESLADAVAFVEQSVHPIEKMTAFLHEDFSLECTEKKYSLALRASRVSGGSGYSRFGFSAYDSGSEGPTLSHSHRDQFVFVWQSLIFWSKVMYNIHRLWVCADGDLLSTSSSYQLVNTGQGLNRVQACPRVRKLMSNLLTQSQAETGFSWVGLSVIHLGDRDVPNALMFIDKYVQIPRFLSPTVSFIEQIPLMCRDERVLHYIENQFGSSRELRLKVLVDYFKHGFDGSGDDGGSCIDGRLTSSWNWTSRLVKKDFYHAFMLAGFQGFDGDFR